MALFQLKIISEEKGNLNLEHILFPNTDRIQTNKIFSISVKIKINEALS